MSIYCVLLAFHLPLKASQKLRGRRLACKKIRKWSKKTERWSNRLRRIACSAKVASSRLGWSETSSVRSGTFSHDMPEIWVVTLSALYRAVVLQERRRRNDVKRSQLPLAAPVQIHDRERARQTGVCLVERAILLDLESG